MPPLASSGKITTRLSGGNSPIAISSLQTGSAPANCRGRGGLPHSLLLTTSESQGFRGPRGVPTNPEAQVPGSRVPSRLRSAGPSGRTFLSRRGLPHGILSGPRKNIALREQRTGDTLGRVGCPFPSPHQEEEEEKQPALPPAAPPAGRGLYSRLAAQGGWLCLPNMSPFRGIG